MKILLAIDDSEFSGAALQMVANQNRPENTEIMVLHVVEPIAALFAMPSAGGGYYPLAAIDWDRIQKQLSEQGQKLLEKAAERLRSANFRVETRLLEVLARTGIVDAAAAWHADLIVLGAHGRTGLERLLLGSVSDFVARHAKCSVEIVRKPASNELLASKK